MARLNAKRRRALAATRARHDVATSLNPSTQADTGQVRSSHKPRAIDMLIPSVVRAYTPKPLNMDSQGSKSRSRPKRWGDK